MKTGHIEIKAETICVLNPCKPQLPYEVHNAIVDKVNENLRLQYRYLEMRLEKLQFVLRTRSQFVLALRKFLSEKNHFVEVETPTLFRKTPGGAREFIVPTNKPDKFYSLPQSPQQFKQLLMVGGIDRYFQIAKCYRDEHTKSDRQPEFTQVDLEMSFVNKGEIYSLVEKMLISAWPDVCDKINIPFPHMNYANAIARYGSDKPDMRIPWQICEVTHLFEQSCPSIFKPSFDCQNFSVQALRLPKIGTKLSKKDLEHLFKKISEIDSLNMIIPFLKVKPDKSLTGSFVKHLDHSIKESLFDLLKLNEGDLIFFAAGSGLKPLSTLGRLRILSADLLEEKGFPVKNDGFHFLWVENFPLFLPKEDASSDLECAHHPFTAPHPEDEHLIYTKPHLVRGEHYDLVLNGCEIGGGSIRIHNSKLQKHVLESVLKEDTAELNHLLEALDSGCPPHGGIALGLDRLISIMLGAESIREVMAFPKSKSGMDPMTRAPCSVDDDTLEFYNIKVVK